MLTDDLPAFVAPQQQPARMTFAELAEFRDTVSFIPMLWKLFRAGWRIDGDGLVKR